MDVVDPVKLIKMLWPHVDLYREQRDILYSLRDNSETVVPAGNQLGKDFVSALAVLWFFLSRHPCRVVTTSVDQGQLEKVLWGEINNFIATAKHKLPFKVNHLSIQKYVEGEICPKSYIIGRVAAKEEGLLGHHLPLGPNGQARTLMVYDEASGINDDFKIKTDTWARKTLVIGNPFPCENFFKKSSKEGSILAPGGKSYYRKVIKIKATDSPNVRLALAQQAANHEPTNEIIVPGVLDYYEYLKRRTTWDKIRQCVSLDAEFYEGAEVLLFPPQWLNHAEELDRQLVGTSRIAKAMGVDPAEGGDKSAWTIVDEYGVIEQIAEKTPDTTQIVGRTIDLINKYKLPASMVLFDRGGGGKQHADRLRQLGYHVGTVGFGEPVSPDKKRGLSTLDVRIKADETRYTFKNRRAQMYGLLSERLDPSSELPFAIPSRLHELRRQLSPIPKLYDAEGRLKLPPKVKTSKDSKEITLFDLLGCSPDEADSLVMAVYRMIHKSTRAKAGAII